MYTRGTVVGDYVVEKKLGEGGVAVVHRVRHRQRATIHALKVLCVSNPVARERLILEGRIQAGLKHPNVVRVSEVVKLEGGVGLIMDYVSGPTLQAWLTRNEPDLEEALQLFAGIVRAVAALHSRGAIHRDLKPANFLLDGDTHELIPRLTDFGIVKVMDDLGPSRVLTHSGAFLGSPSYMPPEQARDPRQVDQRSDLWSLGCILYELLLHRQAFPGSDRVEIANRVARGDFVPVGAASANLPVEVVSALHDLLRVDPAERIQSCRELWERLEGDSRWGPLHPVAHTFSDEFEEPSDDHSAASATFLLTRSRVMPEHPAVVWARRRRLHLVAAALLLVAVAGAWWAS